MATKRRPTKSTVRKKVRRGAEKAAKRIPKKVWVVLFVLAIIAFAAFLLYYQYYVDPLENLFKRPEVQVPLTKGENDLRVHFVDVGQGDGIVVELPDGKYMVIDGGPREAKAKMTGYIRELGIDTIDYVVLTHADEDHVGSLDDVVNEFDVKHIFMPGMTTEQITTRVYQQFCEAAENEKNTIGCVVETTLDDSDIYDDPDAPTYSIDFYSVGNDYYGKVNSKSSAERKNAVSPLMFLTYEGRKVLFTGDANKETEELFLAREEVQKAPDLYDVDVLKVGHHGSRTSTTEEFLEAVQPEHAVIQCGEGNKYGHPTPEALARLEAVGVPESEIYRTDLSGDVVLTISPQAEGEAALNFSVAKSGANRMAFDTPRNNLNLSDFLAGAFLDGRRRCAA